jgi:hypothetical protein
VRDIVYQNQTDSTFANKKDVHFGRFAHQTIALSVGFATLELLINYCDDEHNAATREEVSEEKEGHHLITKEEMRREKLFLPPPLTQDLLLANATAEFEAALDLSHRTYVEYDCDASENNDSSGDEGVVDNNPCVIAWIATGGEWNENKINGFMKQYQTRIDGWIAEHAGTGWSKKNGLIANKANATFSLRFPEVKNDVKTVTIYFMRSYGEKWEDSNAKFTMSRLLPNETNSTVVSEIEIAGVFANKNYTYSLTLSETMRLKETVAKGETLDLQVDLVSGSHFKIMGMMLCNK